MNKQIIYNQHWGGGSTERWIVDDKYLVSVFHYTGSNIWVEPLNCPARRYSGWSYCNETEDECVNRLISRIEHPQTHASWREEGTSSFGTSAYGVIKYVDNLTETIPAIENKPEFVEWVYKPSSLVDEFKYCFDKANEGK